MFWLIGPVFFFLPTLPLSDSPPLSASPVQAGSERLALVRVQASGAGLE